MKHILRFSIPFFFFAFLGCTAGGPPSPCDCLVNNVMKDQSMDTILQNVPSVPHDTALSRICADHANSLSREQLHTMFQEASECEEITPEYSEVLRNIPIESLPKN